MGNPTNTEGGLVSLFKANNLLILSVWLLVEAFETLGVNALVVVCRNREVFHEALAWQTVVDDVQETPKTAEYQGGDEMP